MQVSRTQPEDAGGSGQLVGSSPDQIVGARSEVEASTVAAEAQQAHGHAKRPESGR
jgi:hypothetical protein